MDASPKRTRGLRRLGHGPEHGHPQQSDDCEDDQEDEEQDLGDIREPLRESAESEQRCDGGEHQEDQGPLEQRHRYPPPRSRTEGWLELLISDLFTASRPFDRPTLDHSQSKSSATASWYFRRSGMSLTF